MSAVTFVTAMQYLETHQMSPSGHMAAALVVMESPAILMAVLLANLLRQAQPASGPNSNPSLGKILHESFTDGAQLLLLGAMAVGYLSGEAGKSVMAPLFSIDLFKGMLAFFLLDMGLMVARNFNSVRGKSPMLIAYASVGPLVHAAIALALSLLLGLPTADAALLMGVVGQRLLYCRSRRAALRHPGGQPVALSGHVAGCHLPAEYSFRNPSVRLGRAPIFLADAHKPIRKARALPVIVNPLR